MQFSDTRPGASEKLSYPVATTDAGQEPRQIKLVRDIHVRTGCYANYLRYASWIDEPNDDTINNSNWTEWSGIWAEIIRVISK